jgi:chorismate mutase
MKWILISVVLLFLEKHLFVMAYFNSANRIIGRKSVYSTSNIVTSDLFTLDSIRSTLIRQEETIIFALIERAQYRRNKIIYDPNAHGLNNAYNAPISFFEWMFIETEKLHAKVRRYTSPEEHAFFPSFLPAPILKELNFPEVLPKEQFTKSINVNSEITRWYLNIIVNRICVDGDDEQHGSSVLCDIACLQALSRRIHLGKFVAGSIHELLLNLIIKYILSY